MSVDFQFYKKDAVCYRGGAIKVVSITDGDEVVLTQNNEVIKSGTIINSELIFEDLETGDYTVRVSGNSKRIIINLKD